MSSLFPDDMFIGLGFGLGPESDEDMPEMSIEDGIILKLTDRVQELECALLRFDEECTRRQVQTDALENKVETLIRTLDIWQEMLGIEVVAVPTVPVFEAGLVEETREVKQGVCRYCDRLAFLNDAGICEGCFLEEVME